MNKPNIKKRPLRGLVSLCAIAALAGALLATTAGVASADYGPGALYQIELVDGDNGTGGGIWLWIALYPDGTADYEGSDCLERGGTFGLHGAYQDDVAANPSHVDATWEFSTNCSFSPQDDVPPYEDCSVPPWVNNYTGSCIKISGVYLTGIETAFQTFLGITFQTTITVPAIYGNYTGTNGTFLTFSGFSAPLPPGIDVLSPCAGTSQVQVAP